MIAMNLLNWAVSIPTYPMQKGLAAVPQAVPSLAVVPQAVPSPAVKAEQQNEFHVGLIQQALGQEAVEAGRPAALSVLQWCRRRRRRQCLFFVFLHPIRFSLQQHLPLAFRTMQQQLQL